MIQTLSGGWKIRPARELVQNASFARIEKDEIPKNLSKWRKSENAYNIGVSVDPIKTFSHNYGRVKLRYAKAKPLEGGEENGVLIKTGSAPRKHMQFVFGLPETHDRSDISIPNELIEEYKNQITEGQKKILGAEGVLLNSQSVFYLLEENQLVFFGHAMMFRLPYRSSTRSFIPSQLRSSENLKNIETTDFTDAIFGYARDQKREENQTRCGRVFLTDSICVNFEQERPISPKILASPKSTTFQHYLVQPEEIKADPKKLKHYASEPVCKTVLRGHKLYWHKRDIMLPQIREADIGKINKSKSQYTKIKPLKPGSLFNFSIHFENLSKVELGALLWVLDLAQDEKYRLSLGMGKPLGLGAIKITHKLYLNQRKQRYKTLFTDEQWFTGYPAEPDSSKPYIKAFDAHIRQEIGATESSLKNVRRIKMLLAMLSWTEAPPADQTRYLEIERDASQPHIGTPKKGKVNEYADRPVLPTPLQVIGWEDCNNKNDNPNSGDSGKGNSPKPTSPKPDKGNHASSKPRKSSSARTEKTSMAAALERPKLPKQR
ncbi:TIGR03986 family CRISPR-associated RAMP protein [Synechococcales cyanobacterium C]|uniref:TIGR03986 family CRISPR-associated RAMP protein n=1 Tax=Petrachloros mirabilis ULC683 TaxID=2781853 RepID=A0A8K2A0Y3_9CYAN|nr:TIGR03986 family CRISPR-associated RAMP protein [Petrachloros mirabilis]NCJ07357.1 TIGR03986 family CRISPR-associated RAMP protein [Petrachloros mirabilis ULC683]